MCSWGLWGYETTSGNIPQPQRSHDEKVKKRGFNAVNFAALSTGLRSESSTARRMLNTNVNSLLTAWDGDYGKASSCYEWCVILFDKGAGATAARRQTGWAGWTRGRAVLIHYSRANLDNAFPVLFMFCVSIFKKDLYLTFVTLM